MENNENKIAYRKLIAWQKADDLAFQIYKITKLFPAEEKFGLVSQMRRSAVSVPANIAEGYTRESKNEKVRFYNIASASLTELEYYIDFSYRLSYISDDQHKELKLLRQEVGKLLNGLIMGTRNKWQALKGLALVFLVSSSLFLAPLLTHAATFSFSPSSGEYAVGRAFQVSVYVSSVDQAMNAASGVVSFPQDKLEVTSLSKTGSILTLWVAEPSFSNSEGTVNFEGIVLNPGFKGATGEIITINFRTKAAGPALVNFSSGSALANDGKGTNILTSLGNAQFSLSGVAPTIPESTILSAVSGAPPAPQISSVTHPDPNKWYASSGAKFTWSVSDDATGVRLLIDRIPYATPTVFYTRSTREWELSNLDEGIWYFHVRLRNASGWGETSHFRFQIDTEKPSHFEITEVPREDATEPRAKFIFDAVDKTSGVDYFEIQIDGDSSYVWKDDGSHRYETPVVGPGKHTLIAKVIDKAGNALVNSGEFIIEALEPPRIVKYPEELPSGEMLLARGTTYPKSQVTVWLQREGREAISQIIGSDGDGRFTFIAEEKLKEGIYKLWAEVADSRGARSKLAEKLTISVTRPVVLQISSWMVSLLAVAAPLVVLATLLLFVVWYGLHKFSVFRKEGREAESALREAFDLLKKDIREQVTMLEETKTRRELTEEEEKVIKQLGKNLDYAEKFVKKEIKDIEKEVE